MDKKIGFIGCGNMASAMIAGLVENGYNPESITASNPSPEKLFKQKEMYSINITGDNKEAAKSNIVFLTVKPDKYNKVLKEIKDTLQHSTIIVSPAPSISISSIEKELGNKAKILRTMPNTPALIGMGMTALCPNKLINEEDTTIIESIFNCFGEYEYIREENFPAAVGISGSSPAFVYMFIEALADGGVYEGLPRDIAYKMAAQAVLGSAAMVLQTKEHPGKLKDKVCSPSGTTIEGVRELEKNNFRSAVMEAVIKASEKSKTMS